MGNAITAIFCLAIFCLGVFIGLMIWHCNSRFKSILKELENAKKEEVLKGQDLDADGNIIEKKEMVIKYDGENIDSVKKEYNREYSKYVATAQIIPIFSLLGLLGTVVGLVLSCNNPELKMEELLSCLGFAMYTTAAGLICTIILKIFDALVGKNINDIDSALNMLESKMNVELYKKAGQANK